jgi:hypothetical protein
MKLQYPIILLCIAFFAVNCGSSNQATGIDSEKWYNQTFPTTDEYMFVLGEGISARQSLARNQAMQDGRAKLALKMQGEIEVIIEKAVEENIENAQSDLKSYYKSTSITLAKQSLHGITTARTHLGKTEDGLYVAKLKMQLPLGEASNSVSDALESTLSKDEELYIMFKSTKALDTMKESIKALGNGDLPSERNTE